MSFAYLLALVAASGCLCLIDARWRLYFWRVPWRAAVVTVSTGLFLLVWDLAGIGLGIFLHGDSPWTTGIMIAPQLPIEEPVFLLFLAYLTGILVFGIRRMFDVLSRRRQTDGRADT